MEYKIVRAIPEKVVADKVIADKASETIIIKPIIAGIDNKAVELTSPLPVSLFLALDVKMYIYFYSFSKLSLLRLTLGKLYIFS